MDWRDAVSDMLKPIIESQRLGLISDLDGTLSPIVEVPDQAQITPRNRELLQTLQAHLTLVAIVSGRAVADLQQRVGLPGLTYIGNHGLERWNGAQVILVPQAERFRPQMQAARQELETRHVPGLRLEDKGATLSLHYRQAADPKSLARELQPWIESIAEQHNLRLFQGRMVFELRPPIDIHKGSALQQLVTEFHLQAALYLGDDTTDVDALHMARQYRRTGRCYALGVAVNSPGSPPAVSENADLTVQGVAGVEISALLAAPGPQRIFHLTVKPLLDIRRFHCRPQ